MHPLIENHRATARDLAARHDVVVVRVFGSMALGDASEESDVDPMVRGLPGTSLLLIEQVLDCIALIFEYTGGDREAFFRARLVQDTAILKARVQTA